MPGKFSRTGGKLALGTVPLDVFLALCVTEPTPIALGAEYAAAGYERKVTRVRLPPTDTDPPEISNFQAVTFGPFTDDTGDTVGWIMAMPAAAGGTAVNMIAFWELDEHRTPERGDTLVLDVGALVLNCS
jgi:hypothetical protein